MSTTQNNKDTKTTSANATSKTESKKTDTKKTPAKTAEKGAKSNATKK